MLKSLRNHLITTRRNGGRIVAGGPGLMADAEKKIIGDLMASRNSQSIELSSCDDPTWMSSASRV